MVFNRQMFIENQTLTNRKRIANKSEILKNEEMTFNPSINKRSKEIMMEKENQEQQQQQEDDNNNNSNNNENDNSQLTKSNKVKRSKSVTTTDRLFNDAKIKSERLREREIKEQLKKTEGLTFKPKLNKTSLKLVNEMSEDNEMEESVYILLILFIYIYNNTNRELINYTNYIKRNKRN